jgi:hypothetical protein
MHNMAQALAQRLHSSSSSRGGVGRTCIICLGDEVESAENALLYDVCDCKSTAVHRNCLEVLLNSARRRRMPFARRMRCDVCLHAYAIHYRLATIEPLASGMFPMDIVHRQPAYVRKFDAAIALSLGVALFAKVILTLSGPQMVWPIYGIVTLFASLVASHAVNLRLRLDVEMVANGELARERPVDPLTLPDDAFYERVFTRERASLTARSTSEAHLCALEQIIRYSSSTQLLVLVTAEMAAGSRRVLSPRECEQMHEFAPRPPWDGEIIHAAGAVSGAASDAEGVQTPRLTPCGTTACAPPPPVGRAAASSCGERVQSSASARAPSVRRAHSLATRGAYFVVERSSRRVTSQGVEESGRDRTLRSSRDDELLLPTAVACHVTR